MREAINILRRIIVVSVLVLTTAGMYCSSVDQNIKFVAGYGYVVALRNEDPFTHSDKDLYQYYLVFDTEEAARKWTNDFFNSPDKKLDSQPQTFRKLYSNKDQRREYDEITRLINTPPNTTPSDAIRSIDRAVPPIPTAPAPQ